MKICIDPGHGGRDPGAVGANGLLEKDVNLSVAGKLAELLDGSYDTVLTRTGDSFVSLAERAKVANLHKTAILISVHSNAATNENAQGFETYHFPTSVEGERLARYVQREFIGYVGSKDRGVKQANFQLLRETAMPAILVELGFISNEEEERKLTDPIYQMECAEALATGIDAYLVERFKERIL